jgi:hypothetical protein
MERQLGRSGAVCRSVARGVLGKPVYINGTSKTITVGVAKIRHADEVGNVPKSQG